MKIRSKLSLLFVPILLVCIAGTGVSSFFLAFDALKKREFGALHILAKSVSDYEINSRVELLANSGLDNVPNFIVAYQAEVFEVLNSLANETGRQFIIVDKQKNALLHSTMLEQFNDYDFQDSAALSSSNTTQGEYAIRDWQGLFVKRNNTEWQWDIYVLQDSSVLLSALRGIGFTVLIAVFVSCILALFLLQAGVGNLVLDRIHSIGRATKRLEVTSRPIEINDSGNDEISELAQYIETMSQTLYQSIETANQASQAKSQMLAVLSHEIRTPLNGISGLAKLLTFSELDHKQSKYADDLLRSALSLTNIMNDVLDFSKIEAGKMSLEFSTFNIEEQVRNVTELFQYTAKENGSTITFSSCGLGTVSIVSDVVRVRQILTNFVSNAVKFTHNGRIHVYTCVTADGMLYLCVADSGVGIRQDKQDDIFSIFTQSDNSISRKFGGTGLGLSICDRLVSMLQGRISVSSAEGQGARFVAQVPVKLADHSEQHDQQSLSLEPSEFNAHVLVVEDNEINAIVVTELLDSIGITSELAINGEEALRAAAHSTYDLIFMDVHMPVMNGIAATKELVKRNNQTPIIGLTAESLKSRHDYFKQAGMNDVITKPVTLESLVDVLQFYVPKKIG